VIGSSSTHGKGTVQRFLELNQTLRNKSIPNLGSIKLTTQKFYRINGDATQLKGVSSDILLPDNYMYIHTGEKENDYPMPWDKIDAASYQQSVSYPLALIENSNSRIKASETFSLIQQNARRWETQRDKDVYTLNFNQYSEEQLKEEKQEERFKHLLKDPIAGFYAQNISSDLKEITSEESRVKRNEDWLNKVLKDPYIFEALQIIEDWMGTKG
jgi:carboxyl-terminal processing protease